MIKNLILLFVLTCHFSAASEQPCESQFVPTTAAQVTEALKELAELFPPAGRGLVEVREVEADAPEYRVQDNRIVILWPRKGAAMEQSAFDYLSDIVLEAPVNVVEVVEAKPNPSVSATTVRHLNRGVERDPFVTLVEARALVQADKVASRSDFLKRRRAGEFRNIPENPARVYKSEWKGWEDLLGLPPKRTNARLAPTYAEAKRILKGMGIKSPEDYRERVLSGELSNFPRDPRNFYLGEWVNMKDYLGLEHYSRHKVYVSYEDARQILKEYDVRTQKQYYDLRRDHPELNLPPDPRLEYAFDWRGWRAFTPD